MVHCTPKLSICWYSVNFYFDRILMNSTKLRMDRNTDARGVRELAEKAGVTPNTVTRIENGADAKQSTINKLRSTLEAAGVEFIDENGGGPGVRLRKPQQ